MNIEEIISLVLILHGAAVAIVNLTPTPKDDRFLGKAYKWIELAAGLLTSLSKQEAKKDDGSPSS